IDNMSLSRRPSWHSECILRSGGPARWSRERQRNLPRAMRAPSFSAQRQREHFSRRMEESRMTTLTPNQVTAARVVAAFAAVALFTFGHDAVVGDAPAILLTIAAIPLEGGAGTTRA